MTGAICINPNCQKSAPAHEPFCAEHRARARRVSKQFDFAGNLVAETFKVDPIDPTTIIRGLLETRKYVTKWDASREELEAMKLAVEAAEAWLAEHGA